MRRRVAAQKRKNHLWSLMVGGVRRERVRQPGENWKSVRLFWARGTPPR